MATPGTPGGVFVRRSEFDDQLAIQALVGDDAAEHRAGSDEGERDHLGAAAAEEGEPAGGARGLSPGLARRASLRPA